jgi:hypothetical protein
MAAAVPEFGRKKASNRKQYFSSQQYRFFEIFVPKPAKNTQVCQEPNQKKKYFKYRRSEVQYPKWQWQGRP